ncbi:CIC11C00000000815 [Sungouiella intermedia]|uniref:Translocation protein SEC62 n=1 Tax=Sungouiella intermedia TaxID=45354 RepID=A0A1L0BYU1_9ASCO|nr:CIC11C00000000815 [[Candida] intermedia]
MASPIPDIAASEGLQQGTRVPVTDQKPQFIVNIGNFLRDHKLLKMRTGLLNNQQDISFFRLKRLIRLLLSDEYKKKSSNPRNQLVPIPNQEEAQKILLLLILAKMVIPVEKLHYAQIKENKGWKPNREKPTLRPHMKVDFLPDSYFAWVYEKPNPYMMLYAVLMLAGVFAVVLFPLWPRFMRTGVWYLSMACLGLLGLFFAMAIVRLIIFCVTYLALPQAFWLYPNLFEDCGFFESFVPLYAWSDPAGKKKTKKSKKSKKNVPKIEEITDDTTGAETTGAEPSATSAKKRAVTLEEVDE